MTYPLSLEMYNAALYKLYLVTVVGSALHIFLGMSVIKSLLYRGGTSFYAVLTTPFRSRPANGVLLLFSCIDAWS